MMRPLIVPTVIALALASGACGRTELEPPEPCLASQPPRACQGPCGAGTQACTAGFWGACVVPPSRTCTATCGDGVQQCVGGRWLACVVPVTTRACAGVCGPGTESCVDGAWLACNAPPPKPPKLHAIIRDFHATHPDFELPLMGDHDDHGIVGPELGADGTPVYAGMPDTPTTSGAASFADWYHDVPGQNETTTVDLTLAALTTVPPLYSYRNTSFFPIDNQLFGNEGRPHNYHFTLQAHTTFGYVGREVFAFTGDDDVFVFINRRLAINLGGIHKAESATVSLDASATALGIAPGGTYDLDIFFAERHTTGSDFIVETSITDQSSCE